jgi:hypothetical protein
MVAMRLSAELDEGNSMRKRPQGLLSSETASSLSSSGCAQPAMNRWGCALTVVTSFRAGGASWVSSRTSR